MSVIKGVVTDKNKCKLDEVYVALLNSAFEEVSSTTTNEQGEYILEAKDGYYPFMVAVKDYGENFLEFWCQNINLESDITINAAIDKLEIYGLHCFRVKGGYTSMMVYFRPMSLEKFKQGSRDICPSMESNSIKISINGYEREVYKVNKVEEYGRDCSMTAYLIQVSMPDELLPEKENMLDVQVSDLDGLFGQAAIFF
ncbi:hypothetical protein J2Z44_002637 [Clostridium punense]|uniref:Carboxypeptidase regulatory-like domain-containing protein n=1 Tax=Clostridium punense TaxID=1054297 RepID=A0ABS4K4V0_9CLOT|nr:MULTISPECIES: carboxypeptidase-like regulatory domain-containing protein [Clostridium]EQB86100.1 hypothetical protein M918_15975 [Clostridium sp. BL8]MBP2022812.1 hypothetical protein [Clostridium punense]